MAQGGLAPHMLMWTVYCWSICISLRVIAIVFLRSRKLVSVEIAPFAPVRSVPGER